LLLYLSELAGTTSAAAAAAAAAAFALPEQDAVC
jgi:hypothetical protein